MARPRTLSCAASGGHVGGRGTPATRHGALDGPHGGDTLLLITRAGFVDTNRTNTSFSLVRAVDQYVVVRHSRAPLSILAMIALITVSAAADVPLFTCSAFAAAFLMLTRCLTPSTHAGAPRLRAGPAG